jgi:hypothetical protein
VTRRPGVHKARAGKKPKTLHKKSFQRKEVKLWKPLIKNPVLERFMCVATYIYPSLKI